MNDHPQMQAGTEQQAEPQPAAQPAARQIQRLRHTLRFRLIEVIATERLSPHMARITFGGPDLDGFYSPGFDDHVKLFFPAAGQAEPVLPTLGERGISFPEGVVPPVARDFTPRSFDAAAGRLVIDFALHDTGPATQWARAAKPGQKIGLGGPRGSMILPMDYDWHLLVADATALPALARRLEELPATTPVLALIEVEGPADELALTASAAARITWVHSQDGADPLLAALAEASFPEGAYFAWVACESTTAKRLREALIARGASPKQIRASGYWRRGAVATHDHFDD